MAPLFTRDEELFEDDTFFGAKFFTQGGLFSKPGFTDSLSDIIGLEVCSQWDATKALSYDGSSQFWNSLIANPPPPDTQAILGNMLGDTTDPSTTDPTFVGTVGDPSAKFTLDGADLFQVIPSAGAPNCYSEAIRTDSTQQRWLALAFKMPTTLTATNALMANAVIGFTTGFSVFVQATGELQLVVSGVTGAVHLDGATLTEDTVYLVIVTWDTTVAGTNVKAYINSDTVSDSSSVAFPVSEASSIFPFAVGAEPFVVLPMEAGSEIYGGAFGKGFLTDTLAAKIRQWYNDNHGRTY